MKKILIFMLVFLVSTAWAEPITFFGLTIGMNQSEAEGTMAKMGAIKDVPQPGAYTIMADKDRTAYTIMPFFIENRVAQFKVLFNIETVSDIFIDMYGDPITSRFDKNGLPFFEWSDANTNLTLAEVNNYQVAVFTMIVH